MPRFTAAALVLLATSACALAPKPLPVPEALAATEQWRVEMRIDQRGVRYRFGRYLVAGVRWHDVRQRGGVVDALKGKREYQERYEFAIRDSAQESAVTRVQCDSRDRARGYSVGGVGIELESGLSLECRLFPESDSAATSGTLRIGARNDRTPRGSVERGGTRFEIHGQRERSDDDGELPRAYLVRRDSALVAMLDRTGPGYIHVAPSLAREEQDLVAATLISLLLHRTLIEE